jgi:hypothetical protein
MGLGAKTDRFDMQISKTLVGRVNDQILCLHSHELRVKPLLESSTPIGLVPFIVIILIGIF